MSSSAADQAGILGLGGFWRYPCPPPNLALLAAITTRRSSAPLPHPPLQFLFPAKDDTSPPLHFQSSGGGAGGGFCDQLYAPILPPSLGPFSSVFYLVQHPDGLVASFCIAGNLFEGSCSIISSHSHVLQQTRNQRRMKTSTADLHSQYPESPPISFSLHLKGCIFFLSSPETSVRSFLCTVTSTFQ